LFALYPAAESADLVNLGVATTFSGALPLPAANQHDSKILAFRSDDTQQRPMLPIRVPDDNTVLPEVAGATPISPPDALRFDVQLRYDAPSGDAIAATDPATVSKILRKLPSVMDVAATAQQMGRPGAAYELIIRSAQRRDLVRALQTLQSIYASLHPDIRSRIFGLAYNCNTLEQRLLAASIRQDVVQAKADATAEHRRLRKLLLAAVYPLDGAQACNLQAKASDDMQYDAPNELPDLPRKAKIFMNTLLVYRTW
ncbi:MAG TPA: hypothetical protein VFE17_08095, partial [Candidatus Baltobacteraceae bacterium]|jgi:hypothetical protein|nr:hypothetical protein [Candidatus Baltobacteraceae bacterium]